MSQNFEEKGALKGKTIHRVVFNAITKQSVLEAMQHPRDVDGPLVDAYLARRALDYLVGFTLSPVLWRKLPGSRSAGRVQSVALRIICDRELEIEAFKRQEYWTIDGTFTTPRGRNFPRRRGHCRGGQPAHPQGRASSARCIERTLKNAHVFSVDNAKQASRRTLLNRTSTLQQEASRKLGFSSAKTMQVAQRLYEGVDIDGDTVGLIAHAVRWRRCWPRRAAARAILKVPARPTCHRAHAEEVHKARMPGRPMKPSTDWARSPAASGRSASMASSLPFTNSSGSLFVANADGKCKFRRTSI